MKVLLTGATGFVGRALHPLLLRAGHAVRLAVRRPLADGAEQVVVGEIGPDTDWTGAFAGVDVVVHLAARVHQMKDTAVDPLAACRATNTFGTERLARAAARDGVRRLVFVSSVKAVGERTAPGLRWTEDMPARPEDAYGQSKLEAEQALARVAQETGLEVVIVRPPLVYGPGVGANFRSLLRVVASGWPLPLGCVDNRRSLVAVGNLASALLACVTHPAAAGGTYFVTDGDDVSTAELVRRIAIALSRPSRLLPLPVPLLRLAGALTGHASTVQRLTESMAVDSTRIRRDLGWMPPLSMQQALADTVAGEAAE